MIIEIATEWETSPKGRLVQEYFINDIWCGTKLRGVHRAIRVNHKVPTKVIKTACLLAKAEECVVQIRTSMLGWIARRKL